MNNNLAHQVFEAIQKELQSSEDLEDIANRIASKINIDLGNEQLKPIVLNMVRAHVANYATGEARSFVKSMKARK
ncbi:MAG: hypothetical protein ACPGXK_00055 [Phycisphaerae bacterium]